MFMKPIVWLCLALALVLAPLALRGQDTRRVTEPAIPPICTVVTANLTAIDGNKTLAESDEAKLDTSRIQQAIDACPKGQAVELRPIAHTTPFFPGRFPCAPAWRWWSTPGRFCLVRAIRNSLRLSQVAAES